MTANLFGPDLGYIVIIVLVVLVGGSQLPKIARNIGTAGKEFRQAQQEAEQEAQRDHAATSHPAPDPAPAALAANPPPPAPHEAALNLSRAELDALLKAREDQVRGEIAG